MFHVQCYVKVDVYTHLFSTLSRKLFYYYYFIIIDALLQSIFVEEYENYTTLLSSD